MAHRRVKYQGICPKTGKRGFADEHDARKARGQARTQGFRRADRERGTRRGLHMVNRVYYCTYCGLFHLTAQSRRDNDEQMGGAA